MKTILVIGGTVFVSKYIAKYFVEKGDIVYVLNRNSRKQVDGVKLIEADRHYLKDELRNLHFDVVIDVTAYKKTDIVDFVPSLKSFDKYIMISSSAVYPETNQKPFLEDDVLGSNKFWGVYGTNKIDAEQSLKELIPNAYIIRPPYLYGPMNNVYREAFVFECAMNDRKFYLPRNGEMKIQFYYIKDLCQIIDEIIKNSPNEHVINVGNKKPISIREWVNCCYSCIGKKPEFVEIFEDIEQRNYFSFYDYEYCLNVDKQCEISKKETPIEEGLLESFRWYKDNVEDVKRKDFIKYIDENF